MTRVKRGTIKNKHRKNILKQAKGYRFGRSTKKKMAKTAIRHAGSHAFAHRKLKKRTFRRLWNIKINAAARALGTTYSKLIGGLHKKGMNVNRKVLADMAENNPETFKRIVEQTQ